MVSLLTSIKSLMADVPGYDVLFHSQVVSQHKQFYFYNKQHRQEIAGVHDKKNFVMLNQANLRLGRLCKSMIEAFEEGAAASDDVDTLRDTLKQWQDSFNTGETFDTFRYAACILDQLRACSFPVDQRLSASLELHQSFRNIPHATKSFFQLSVVVPEAEVVQFLHQSMELFQQRHTLWYYVREFTVYQAVVRVRKETSDDALYVMKYILLPGIVNSRLSPVVQQLAEAISSTLPSMDPEVEINPYAQELTRGVFVSQGSTNYKKFLQLLGILDDVYDASSGYAYLK